MPAVKKKRDEYITKENKVRRAKQREAKFAKNRKKRKGYKNARALRRAVKFGKLKETQNEKSS